MSFTRRTFLVGAGTGLSVLVLTACSGPEPTIPTGTPTPAPSDTVPAPARLWRSNWAGDPLAKGAVSFIPVGSDPQDRTSLRSPLMSRVFFAGEATTSGSPGTVRGAIASGARAAREVVDAAAAGERIAIVGAGAAGAEAARVLTALGVDVIVFEARDRPGGRIDSRVDESGTFFELGAWELAADEDSALIADLDTVPLDGTLAVTVSGGLATGRIADLTVAEDDVTAQLEAWSSAQSTEDTGIASSLDASGAASAVAVGDIPPDTAAGLYVEAARIASGAEPESISTWYPPTGIGATSVIPTSELSDIVTTKLDGVTLALSTAVVAVAYDDDGVSLRLGTGESRRVDRAIITVPLGVLKSGAVEFDPPLPLPMRSAIDSVGFGQLEIVRVAFDEAFWTTDAALWSLVGTDAEIATWVNMQPLTGQATLLGIAAGDAAASLSDVDDAALTRMVRQMLAPFAS